MSAPSKGGWVWDHLRIRGTVSGHQKDYELAGIVGGYVPRKATYGPLMQAGDGWRQMSGKDRKAGRKADYVGEIFLPRKKFTVQRNWVTSIKPLSPAYGSTGDEDSGPNRGKPNNGRPAGPNRGTPNRGR
jgi:hypothetical protein